MEFTNGTKLLFTGYDVDSSPAYVGDTEPPTVTETVLNLSVLVENGITYFVNAETNEKQTFEQLTMYYDDFEFEVLKM